MKEKDKSRMPLLFPRCKVWLSTLEEEGVFGDGKWRLLQEIEYSRSIRAAALALGMSYRKAWGDLKKAESCLGAKLIEKHRGGADGGETSLTREGKTWLEAYEAFREEIREQLDVSFEKHMKKLGREIEER
jgi:molybdate transport system regulatory protein